MKGDVIGWLDGHYRSSLRSLNYKQNKWTERVNIVTKIKSAQQLYCLKDFIIIDKRFKLDKANAWDISMNF